MRDNLVAEAAQVNSREDFVAFLKRLAGDYRDRGQEWENDDLGAFLEGLAGFSESIGSYYANVGETVDINTPTWRMMAQMLLAATVYE